VRDKHRRREDILRAARDVFAREGFHEAKVEDIAAAARVAKGTVYLYFPDKSSIMQELIDRVLVQLEGAILRVDITNGDVSEQVLHNIRAVVGVFLDDPTLPKILLSPLSGGDPDFQRRLQEFLRTVHGLLREALSDGQHLTIIAPGDANVQASFILGALKELLLQAALKGVPREAVVEGLYQMLSVGLFRWSDRPQREEQAELKRRFPQPEEFRPMAIEELRAMQAPVRLRPAERGTQRARRRAKS
jgi:AcrR family transcriptional regulator